MGESDHDVHLWTPEIFSILTYGAFIKRNSEENLTTFYHNVELQEVDDKLETMANDKYSNNNDQHSGNHKITSLSFSQ